MGATMSGFCLTVRRSVRPPSTRNRDRRIPRPGLNDVSLPLLKRATVACSEATFDHQVTDAGLREVPSRCCTPWLGNHTGAGWRSRRLPRGFTPRLPGGPEFTGDPAHRVGTKWIDDDRAYFAMTAMQTSEGKLLLSEPTRGRSGQLHRTFAFPA